MDKVTQLLIRACKSRNPKTRIQSVMHRFYFISRSDYQIGYPIVALTEIVDEYLPMKTYDLYKELLPRDYLWEKDERTIEERMFDFLINKIALTEVSKFEGFETPRRFR